MDFVFFLGAAAVMVFWYFVGKEFSRIAAMKGHTESRYFWWTFLVAPIGMAMVIALPNKTKVVETKVIETKVVEKAASSPSDELPDI